MKTNHYKQRIIDLYVMKYLYVKYKNKSKKKIEKFKEFAEKRKVILFCVPTHGNLGDHAIAYAGKKFIQDMFPDRTYFEFGITEIYQNYYAIKNMINEDDIIFLIGGGNMNDVYWYEEWTRRNLVKEYKNNPIISLPVTARFSNTFLGNMERYNSALSYKSAKKMLFLAREQYSYDFINDYFSKDVKLVPDIVLSLGEINTGSNERNGIAVCFRDDIEASIIPERKEKFLDMLKNNFNDIDYISTFTKEKVTKENKENILYDKWKEFSKYKLVITDRLHGMIFCAITNTPCIVLPNNDGKVKSTYQVWLKDFTFIHYFEELELNKIENSINELVGLNFNNSFNNIDNKFNLLKEYIKSEFLTDK